MAASTDVFILQPDGLFTGKTVAAYTFPWAAAPSGTGYSEAIVVGDPETGSGASVTGPGSQGSNALCIQGVVGGVSVPISGSVSVIGGPTWAFDSNNYLKVNVTNTQPNFQFDGQNNLKVTQTPAPMSAAVTSQTVLSPSATLITTQPANRKAVIIKNVGSGLIFIGFTTGLTASNGHILGAAETLRLDIASNLLVYALDPLNSATVSVVELS